MTAKLTGIYLHLNYGYNSENKQAVNGSLSFAIAGGTVTQLVDPELSELLHTVILASYDRHARAAITSLQESTQPVLEHIPADTSGYTREGYKPVTGVGYRPQDNDEGFDTF